MADPILLGIGAGIVIGVIGIVITLATGLNKSSNKSVSAVGGPASQLMPADEPQTTFPAPRPLVLEPAEEPLLPVPETRYLPADAAGVSDAVEGPQVAGEIEPEDAELAPEPAQAKNESDTDRAAKAPYASGLVAPVELWVGDTRIVVKDGTRTQLKFRSYADSLLSALKEAKDETDKGV
ncbi:MAG TPA: hypothetical protein VFG89_07480 [Coriobacteriia bacterium]|nr:hypothetical protein [Coriobacteriia bacterium]